MNTSKQNRVGRTLATVVGAIAVSVALPVVAKAGGISSKPTAITLRATMPSYAGIGISAPFLNQTPSGQLEISSHYDGGSVRAAIRVVSAVVPYGANTLDSHKTSETNLLQSGTNQKWILSTAERSSGVASEVLNIRIEVY